MKHCRPKKFMDITWYRTSVAFDDRWRQLETRTWSWVDCRNQTLADTLSRSAVWLSIYWISCLALRFDIALMKRWNFASEYTPDLALQVN